jgi:hypothetical protein
MIYLQKCDIHDSITIPHVNKTILEAVLFADNKDISMQHPVPTVIRLFLESRNLIPVQQAKYVMNNASTPQASFI